MTGAPEISPQVFHVEVDSTANLVLVRYCGRVIAAEVKKCAAEIATRVGELQPGFRLLVDLTDLDVMEIDCATHLERIMNLCNEKGVATVARIIPDPRRDIGLQIMSYFHYDPEVRVVTCATAGEAMDELAF